MTNADLSSDPKDVIGYIKIGNIDICDKWGNYKFSDKSYAQEVAKKWCECGGNW